jgi:hypothetical protein
LSRFVEKIDYFEMNENSNNRPIRSFIHELELEKIFFGIAFERMVMD